MNHIIHTKHRILLVDDTPSIHKDFRLFLAPPNGESLASFEAELFGPGATREPAEAFSAEFELASAYHGQEALDLVEAAILNGTPFGMAFVDVRMPPGWDGIKTIEQLWRIDPILEIVICTAYSDYSWSEIAKRLAPSKRFLILKKPLEGIEVRQLAMRALRQSQLNQIDNLKTANIATRSATLVAAGDAPDKANAAGSKVLANMRHEIRTPMNAIRGLAQLLQIDPGLSPQQRLHIGAFNRSCEHLTALINEVSEMSRIEPGCEPPPDAPVHLKDLIDDLGMMFRHLAEEKNLGLGFEIAPHLPPFVFGDEAKLRQVLINLLSNAIMFTTHGRVDLRTRWEDANNGKVRLRFEVEDTGAGVIEEDWERIFATFEQTNVDIQSDAHAISRNQVPIMGGEMTLEGEEGRGSIFSFTIEVQRACVQANHVR